MTLHDLHDATTTTATALHYLHYKTTTTPLHYTTTATSLRHTKSNSCGEVIAATTANANEPLRPVFETYATALCGTPGECIQM